MSKYLNRAQILSAEDVRYVDVLVPEWAEDGMVRVKSLSGAEKDAFEASIIDIRQVEDTVVQRPNMVNMRAKLAALCMVDENGTRLFSDEDVLELGRKSSAALDRVVEVAKRLSKISKADLKVMVENLKNDRPAALPSD